MSNTYKVLPSAVAITIQHFIGKLSERSDETVANIAIILIHQTDYLITRLFERLKQDFIKEGGVKEQMYKARMSHLKKNY